MKKMFKLFAVILSFVMMVTILMPISTTQAAKIKLNYTKKTIYEGDTFKLKVKGTKKKVKWSSSNKGIASVNSRGVVTGECDGKVTIIAKVAGKKLKCKIVVKEASKVTYINNRSVEYSENDNVERLFFGFKDQYNKVVSGSGNVNIRIENNGEIVYQKRFSYNESNFNYWTNALYGERYLCSIDIPVSDIKEGKNNSGKLYYKVTDQAGEFDEYSLNVSNLPQAKRKIEVDTNSYIPDKYNPENKAQIIKYNVTNDKIFLTYKMVQIGTPDRGNYGAYVYQYDKDGNIISEMYLYTNNLTVGTTVTDSYYLENDTVRIGFSTNGNEANNNSSNNTKPKTGSVSENITLLKQYIKTNGSTNTNGEKFISDTTSGQTSSIVYSEQTGELKFVTSSSDSGLIMTMSSANNSSSMQANYVLSSGGVGILATGYVNPSTYSSGSSVRFSITNATPGLTDDDVQEVCNSELKAGFASWQVILYKELMLELKDIGFTAYN